MRVLLISHTCMSATEGQPKAAELARRHPDVELTVLVPDRWRNYGQWRGVDRPASATGTFPFDLRVGSVRWAWSGPGQWYLHHYRGLRQLLDEVRPDVIDLWEEPWGAVSAQACRLRNRFLPTTRIVSETEQNVEKRLPPPFEWFRRYTLRNADHVVGRNAEAVGLVRRKGYRGPATVVPNAVDSELFHPPVDRDGCRAALGVTGFCVGYVGRLVPEKGLAELVEAVAACGDGVTLLLVGSGEMRDALLARAAVLGCAGRVTVLPAKPLAELPHVMGALDVLALPSRTTPRWKEQFGRVIIEAHACGVPVIGSDSGAIPDVVGDGGVIAPERDAAALAAALGRLRDDAGLARRLGAAGRRQVEANYTWGRVADQMYDVYRSLVPAGGARGTSRPTRSGGDGSGRAASCASGAAGGVSAAN